jgi:hypothetical protein
MDPATVGAVLLAVVGGAGGQLGAQLWAGVGALVRRPFRSRARARAASALLAGDAELAALEQVPADRERALALAEVLLARARADAAFGRALEDWWEQASPVRVLGGNVTNAISGGTQHGPVLQGRDFSNLTFGGAQAGPPVPPSPGPGT